MPIWSDARTSWPERIADSHRRRCIGPKSIRPWYGKSSKRCERAPILQPRDFGARRNPFNFSFASAGEHGFALLRATESNEGGSDDQRRYGEVPEGVWSPQRRHASSAA